jgi:hypothetical protein
MKFFPESALTQLEFDKVQALLEEHCKTEYAKTKALELRIHTRKEFIELELQQSHEYKLLIEHSMYFPNDYVLNFPAGCLLANSLCRCVNWPKACRTFSAGSITTGGWHTLHW